MISISINELHRQRCHDHDDLMTWIWDVASTSEQMSWKTQCCWFIARIWIWEFRQQQLMKHDTLTFFEKLQHSTIWLIKIEYKIVMIESCAEKRCKERNRSRDQMWLIWWSLMKDIEEEITMKTMSLELIFRNSLIEEDVFDDVSVRIRNAFNFHLISLLFTLNFSLHSWTQVSSLFISFSDCFALAWYDDHDQLEQN